MHAVARSFSRSAPSNADERAAAQRARAQRAQFDGSRPLTALAQIEGGPRGGTLHKEALKKCAAVTLADERRAPKCRDEAAKRVAPIRKLYVAALKPRMA